MTLPLVTCLCLTRNRREFLRQAIACFRAQTYAGRELLIVADTEEDVAGLTAEDCGDPRIEVVLTRHGLNVGRKRNAGITRARGLLIAHWDDDDHSGPERLADQVLRLVGGEKEYQVTGYRSMKFTDGKRWWRYQGPPGTALGTSLVYQHSWWREHPFAEKQIGQDEEFAAEAHRYGQLIAAGDLGQMYATIHPGNTAPRALAADCYAPCSAFVHAYKTAGL